MRRYSKLVKRLERLENRKGKKNEVRTVKTKGKLARVDKKLEQTTGIITSLNNYIDGTCQS